MAYKILIDTCKNQIIKDAITHNQPLDNFDTSNVTNMSLMFKGVTSMFIGCIMRFVAKVLFVYKKFDAMIMKNDYPLVYPKYDINK